MVAVADELESIRQNLLDLSLRNNLLNYKTSKRRTIPIIEESPREIYDIFVIQEKSMKFQPRGYDELLTQEESDAEVKEISDAMWSPEDSDKENPAHYYDQYLNTPFRSEELEKRLFYIYNQANLIFEEQGYPVIYLALGFLRWKETTDSTKFLEAPLILIPVEIKRIGAKRSFVLKWTGDDLFASITLQAKLSELGIELPEFEMPEDKYGIDSYFQSVSEAISKKSGWCLLTEIFLDFFNFKKFVMYKDLDPTTWPENSLPSDHPLIQKIFNPNSNFTNQRGFSENEVDEKLSVKNTYHILDADSSQIAAIEDVKNGIDLVVEGPPGTGKSQTIANMIAELIMQGKSVLFVSEKMAALEVVKSRLDRVGIGDLCLEIHSNKAKKKEVIDELKRTVEKSSQNYNNFQDELNELEKLKSELNSYAKLLSQPIGKRGLSLYKLYGINETVRRYFVKNNRSMLRVQYSGPEEWDNEEWYEAVSVLGKLKNILPLVSPINKNCWKGCKPQNVLPPDLEIIEQCIDNCHESIEAMEILIAKLGELAGTTTPALLSDLEVCIKAAKIVAESKAQEKYVLANSQWDTQSIESSQIISKLEEYHCLETFLKNTFNNSISNLKVDEFLYEFKNLTTNKHEIIDCYISTPSIGDKELVADLETVKELNELKDYINKIQDEAIQLFGYIWKKEETNPDILETFGKWIVSLRAKFMSGELSEISFDILSSGLNNSIKQETNWDEMSKKTEYILSELMKYKSLNSNIETKFNKSVFDQDVQIFENLSRKFLKSWRPKYRNLRKSILNCYKSKSPLNDNEINNDLKPVIELKKVLENIEKIQFEAEGIFGPLWKKELTDPKVLKEFIQLYSVFKSQQIKGLLSPDIIGILKIGVDKSILQNSKWNTFGSEIEKIIYTVRKYRSIEPVIKNKFKDSIFEKNLDYSIDKINLLAKKKNEASKYYLQIPENDLKIISDLEIILQVSDLKKEIIKLRDRGIALFGIYWKDELTDPEALKSFSEWVIAFRGYILQGRLSKESIDIVSRGVDSKELNELIENLFYKLKCFKEHQYTLFELLNTTSKDIFGKNIEYISCSELFGEHKYKLSMWKTELQSLVVWSQFISYENQCLHTVASPFVEMVKNSKIDAEDLINTFIGNYSDSILKIAFKEKALLDFVPEIHESKIKRFIELDKRIITRNPKRLVYQACCNRPNILSERSDVLSGASKDSEVGILLHEFNRKRRYMPIRKLMISAGSLIKKIKPCFMMSPLSIAQYLDPKSTEFDVIIFDEASQVKPEDALGALLRGNKAVIMGDSRQLPPTSFFDHVVDTQDTEEEDFVCNDMESILNMCKMSFPFKSLRWHYRSRHESLIAVSNQAFYNNHLYVYPSPMLDSEDLGLKFVYLPDTIYDRGNSGKNRGEARAIAKEVFEHYQKFPEKSLGVGTFNSKQQEAIWEEIEVLRRSNPQMEQYITNKNGENFFVKNIETIQGDERDVIFISIGYGFDGNHKLSLNFGPLNHEGGERRLNVLITRAREKCVVFSNFKATDLNIKENASFGLKTLKIFLGYAETKEFDPISGYSEDTESPFEDSVYEFLRDNGYEVRKQVGCAGYRIDLAIVDQYNPGRYVIGIECDGAQYHSSHVARDRDRLRQEILENLGWKIYRVWSTDWYRQQRKSGEKLLKSIEDAKKSSIVVKIKKDENSSSLEPFTETQHKDSMSIIINRDQNLDDVSSVEIPCNESEFENQPRIQNKEAELLEDRIPEYKVCPLNAYPTDFYEIPTSKLESMIVEVVDYQGPIHMEELLQLMRSHFDIRLIGDTKKRISRAILRGQESQSIKLQNNFLWPNSNLNNLLRRRCGNTKVNIEWICEEEITEAVKFVLRNQYSMSMGSLIKQTSLTLGIKNAGQKARSRIEAIIQSLIEDNILMRLPNDRIYFAK